jgi:hypothetical protein
MNGKVFERSWSWRNAGHFVSVRRGRVRKTTAKVSQGGRPRDIPNMKSVWKCPVRSGESVDTGPRT